MERQSPTRTVSLIVEIVCDCPIAYTGGKRRIDRDEFRRLSASGLGPTEVGRQLSVSRRQVYRILEEPSKKARRRGSYSR